MNAIEAQMHVDCAVLRAVSAGNKTRAAIRTQVRSVLDYVAPHRSSSPEHVLSRSLVRLVKQGRLVSNGAKRSVYTLVRKEASQ